MNEYIKKRGKVIVINPEKDKTMVQVGSYEPMLIAPVNSIC